MLSMQVGQHDALHLDDAKLSRRSLSIFSRRGVEAPEPQFLSARSYTQPLPLSARVMKPKKSKGTILNAVPVLPTPSPPKKKGKVSSSPLDFACETASSEATFLKHEQVASQKRTSGHKKKYSDDRIGVWVDGVVHWDDGVRTIPQAELTQRPSTSYSRPRAKSEISMKGHRPSLSVVIPHGKIPALPTRPSSPQKKAYSPRKHHSEGSTRLVSPCSTLSKHDSYKRLSPVEAVRAGSSASQREDPSRSSSNASSSVVKEDVSVYSKRSSSTSLDGLATRRTPKHKQTASIVANPRTSHEDLTPVTKAYANKPLPPVPHITDVMRLNPLPPMEANNLKFPSPPRSTKSTPAKKKDHPLRQSSTLRRMTSGTKLDAFDEEFMKTSPYNPALETSTPSSPTLSEAEDDLEESLGALSRHISMLDMHTRSKSQEEPQGLGILNLEIPSATLDMGCGKRDSVAFVMQPPEQAPLIPKKSRKRDWRKSTSTELNEAEVAAIPIARRLSDSMTPTNDAPPSDWWTKHRLSRSVSSPTLPKLQGFSHLIERDSVPKMPSRFALDDGLIVVDGPKILTNAKHEKKKSVDPAAAQVSAERVLVRILETLTTMDDLMNTRCINKGMHRVYLENEMRLIRTVCKNQSPAAWELREWSPVKETADDEEEDFTQHTPATYLQALKRDTAVINQLKSVIVAECASFIRRDTVAAMVDAKHPQAQRITDAFWRIWTFCSIFGSSKGRDEDLTGQLDWLKGGRVANNLDCAATVNVQFDFDAASILLNAPEYFGQGNSDGLTADQLYDITEIWTCMAVLLQGYLGRVEQAREYGVYDNCAIEKGDSEAEEYMLEEWIAWILTFGPKAVLEMAEYASDLTATGFHLAKERGWTNWAPPVHTTSRVTFLKEPVTRLYEERVTAAHAKAQNAREQAEKEKSRRRIAAHALEIKIRRQDSAFKRVPLIDMSMERPMSILSTLSGGAVLTPRFPPKIMSLPPVPPPAGVHPALRLNATSLMPPGPTPLSHSSTPEDREALRTLNGVAVDTTEVAIQRIVSMGFTAAQAVFALKTTDTGDGLRVDRAVDMLLRSHNAAPEWT